MKIIAKKHFRTKIGRNREREKMKRGTKEKERKKKRKEEEEGRKKDGKKEEGVHTRFFQILEYLPNQYA